MEVFVSRVSARTPEEVGQWYSMITVNGNSLMTSGKRLLHTVVCKLGYTPGMHETMALLFSLIIPYDLFLEISEGIHSTWHFRLPVATRSPRFQRKIWNLPDLINPPVHYIYVLQQLLRRKCLRKGSLAMSKLSRNVAGN